MDEATFLSLLVADWRASARPLIIADEVRYPDTEFGEIIAFVLVCTDTQRASEAADAASAIRARMLPEHAEQLFKGAHLYGSKDRPHLNELRSWLEATIGQCAAVLKVTTTSQTVTRYRSIAPGGIRRQDGLANVEGRELVPFLNMVKLAATAMKAGPTQVDVLLDRSFKLGLDPGQLRISEDQIAIFEPEPGEPGTFNTTRGGAPALYVCPSSFRLICPPKHGPFRDLLLLPDAIAYRMRPGLKLLHDELARVDFQVDAFPQTVERELFANLGVAGVFPPP